MNIMLNRAKKKQLNFDDSIVRQAYGNMIKNYEDTILFLIANK
jgi:hypothetical protein